MSELKEFDEALSYWVTKQAGMKVRVYRSSWRRTYSFRSIAAKRGNICLGGETLAMSRPALTFVLHHEIAHLAAKGGRWRRIASWILYYMDSIRDLKANRSMLLERQGPPTPTLKGGVQALFKEKISAKIGLFWMPTRLACALLEPLELLLGAIIGPSIRKEELYADRLASQRMGRIAKSAIAAAAIHYKKIENLKVLDIGRAVATACKAWYAGGLGIAITVFASGMKPTRFRKPRLSWYPSWKERYLQVATMTLTGDPDLIPPFTIMRVPLGDRIVVSDSEIAVRSFAYLHPALIVALPIYLFLALSNVFALAYWLYQMSAEAGILYPTPNLVDPLPDPMAAFSALFVLIPTAGLFLVTVYGFLAGEAQFVLHKSQLPFAAKLSPVFDRSDSWLSLELPKSLRTRLVLSTIPSPVIVLLLAFNVRRLLHWLKKDAYALEILRRLGKLNGIDRIGLMGAFRFDPDAQLLTRIRLPREVIVTPSAPLKSATAV